MTNEALKIGDFSASDLFTQITAAGVSQSQAAVLVGNWLLETAGRSQRVFSFKTDFPADDPDCAFDFQRGFQHQDWVDGSSVVQAESSPSEEGFNARFHDIEQDIDNLSSEVAKALLCLAEMRRDLRAMMDEVRTAINLLNGDVFDLKGKPGTVGPFETLPGRLDLTPKFVGVTKFFDKNVNVWQTADGIVMLPGVISGGLDAASNPRVKRAGSIARFIEDEPAFRQFFSNQPVTKERIITQFGDRVLPDGGTVREAVAILPDNARFNSVEALVDGIADREAAAIRTAGADVAVITAALGVGEEVTTVGEASVSRLEAIPPDARTALAAAGIDTLEKLSQATPADLATRLRASGVTATAGEAAAWTASARTLVRVR